MEKVELDVVYKVSDYVHAALAYRKSIGDYKVFVIIVWVLVAFVFVSYLLPGLLIPLLCIPFHVCPSGTLLDIAQVGLIGIGGCGLLLLIAYSNILYRLRMEYTFRIGFAKFKEEYQELNKIVTSIEGIEVNRKTYRTTIYWKSFQQILESRDAFLLVMKKYNYVLIPKSAFRNLDQTKSFSEMLISQTGQQIKSI
jgi:hypothetical protein